MRKIKVLFTFMLMLTLASPLFAQSPPSGNGEAKIEYSVGDPSGRPRSPLFFDIDVTEVNNCLEITFRGYLTDVNIIISDTDGSIVYQESNGSIYNGKTIYINPADGYPYDLVITSSIINIVGVIYVE